MSAREDYSWSEIATKDAAGLCPSSPDYAEPHIVTDGRTCDECGASVTSPPISSQAGLATFRPTPILRGTVPPMTTTAPQQELPEDRVRAFSELRARWVADGIDVELIDWARSPEGGNHPLIISDLVDVLNEVAEWRKLATDRAAVIDNLAQQVADLTAEIAWLKDCLADYVDPAPQGDPIGATDD
jgi:hypothetical protein